MLRCMDSAVAGLRAHQNKMDVVGHNIANVNTFGFKAQTYTFKEAMYQTATTSTGNANKEEGNRGGVNAAQFGYGSLMGSIGMDMTEATPTYTGGFNAHISGDGFFITKINPETVPVGGGEDDDESFVSKNFMYTRVGQFTVDSQGFIVDSSGNYVYGFKATESDTGASTDEDATTLVPLRAPKEFLEEGNLEYDYTLGGDESKAIKMDAIQIDSAGKISVVISGTAEASGNTTGGDATGDTTGGDATGDTTGGGGVLKSRSVYIGTVAIATFQNPNGLSKVGSSYYTATAGGNAGEAAATAPGEGSTPSLMTGYIEGSNVDLAKEFSDMITTHRGFQANSKMITVADEMLQDLVSMKR